MWPAIVNNIGDVLDPGYRGDDCARRRREQTRPGGEAAVGAERGEHAAAAESHQASDDVADGQDSYRLAQATAGKGVKRP